MCLLETEKVNEPAHVRRFIQVHSGPQKKLVNHGSTTKTKLVCKTCEELGYTAKNIVGIQCEGFCGQVLGSMKFDVNIKKNAKRQIGSKAICKD